MRDLGDQEDTLVVPKGEPRAARPLDRIDRYEVVGKVGAGGMGEVFKAFDPILGRLVAIKRVLGGGTVDGQRLRREAQAIARLSHPNVIAVFDVGESGGELYMAMEYVQGLPLGAWLDQRRPAQRAVLEVFLQAARGLAAAHDAGLVHRDFKPSNVLVGEDGRVRVLDFGLARTQRIGGLGAETGGLEAGSQAEDLTGAGGVVGTPRYMSREQLLGQALDGRADQFAFSVALYEALTRTRPFDRGGTLVDLAKNVFAGRVRPISAELGLPKWLTDLILRGLRPNAADRCSSMHEVIRELERDRESVRRRALEPTTTDLVAAFPPPDGAADKSKIASLRERFEHVADLKRRGDFEGALSLAEVVVREAEEVEYPPLHAASLYMLGNLQHRLGDSASARATLYRSAEIAARAGDDWQVANVWVFLVGVTGLGLGRFQEAEALSSAARVAIARLGENPALTSRLRIARGQCLRAEGRLQDALREYELALSLDEDTHGTDHPLVAVSLSRVADALIGLERYDVARRQLRRALDIGERSGKQGPTHATCLLLLGRALLAEGEVAGAERALLDAGATFARYPDRRADLAVVEGEIARCREARVG